MSTLKTRKKDGAIEYSWEIKYSSNECTFTASMWAVNEEVAKENLKLLKTYNIHIHTRSCDRVVTAYNHSVSIGVGELNPCDDFYTATVPRTIDLTGIWTGTSSLQSDLIFHLIDLIDTGAITGSRDTNFKG